MEADYFRGRSFDIEPATKRVYVVPSATGWDLVRFGQQNGAWEVRAVANVEEAAQLLQPEDDIVLALPVELVLTDVGATDIVPPPSAEYGACNATVCATHGIDEDVVAVSVVAGPVPGCAMSAIVERARLFDVVELTV